ncbi:SDR family oxidoreductase [Candidatus Uabimicrobium amorphum]|uniref:Short-chain dehydrogenase n=1 Tax=Uabimicrobium amorphum TaxID=2596890 RepID=A0A5S9F6V1_UABAM|nr:SDR family oxidoreductase [Candidatus Uabimicrobium amorphum]BBM87751.1 short-chain dehydrogenase [Candidatus Uabimicrobium amorphum]
MNILITGANRGLGLEFVQQYAENSQNRIFACSRNPQTLEKENVSTHKLDVTATEDIDNLKQQMGETSIDILIHNAGVYGSKSGFGSIDVDSWIHTLKVNTIAPIKLSEALIDNVAASDKKTIVIVTSKMGSISDNTSGGSYVYRSSKSAVNMAGVSMSRDLKEKGITVLLLHPGWVETDMGGPNALLKPKESIEGMRKVIREATINDSGTFFAYDGQKINW